MGSSLWVCQRVPFCAVERGRKRKEGLRHLFLIQQTHWRKGNISISLSLFPFISPFLQTHKDDHDDDDSGSSFVKEKGREERTRGKKLAFLCQLDMTTAKSTRLMFPMLFLCGQFWQGFFAKRNVSTAKGWNEKIKIMLLPYNFRG